MRMGVGGRAAGRLAPPVRAVVLALLAVSTLAQAQEPGDPPPRAELSLPEELGWALDEVARLLAEGEHELARGLLGEVASGETFGALLEAEPSVVTLGLSRIDELSESTGQLELQLRVREELHARRAARLPPDHLDLLAAKMNLGLTRLRAGDVEGGHELFEVVHEACERLLPPDDTNLLGVKLNLAVTRKLLGDAQGALELEEHVVATRSRSLPADHPELLDARENLALSRMDLGDLAGAHEQLEGVHESRARRLPADDPALLRAKLNLAATSKQLGDAQRAVELEEEVYAVWRLLPAEHPDRLRIEQALVTSRRDLGDLAGALELGERVHAARERILPAGHPDLLDSKESLAVVRGELGDLEGARELLELVHAARARVVPEDDLGLLDTELNLAWIRAELGDLQGALVLEERVHATLERALPRDHPALLDAKQNLAASRRELGDFDAALALHEHVYEVRRESLGAKHPAVLAAKLNLAVALDGAGEAARSRELLEAVHEDLQRVLPPGHPDLLTAKQNLAAVRRRAEDLQGALELELESCAALEARLPADHPSVLDARSNLAVTRARLGDLEGARELLEQVHRGRARILPPWHPDLLDAGQNLATIHVGLGDGEAALGVVRSLLAGQLELASTLRLEAPRVARAAARRELGRLAWIAGTIEPDDPEDAAALDARLFSAVETLRLVSTGSSEVARAAAGHPGIRELRNRLRAVRAELNDLTHALPEEAAAVEGWRRSLVGLAAERDGLQKEVRIRLRELGIELDAPGAGEVAGRLREGEALVCYWRRGQPARGALDASSDVDALIAFLVTRDGRVRRVDLGPVAPVEQALLAWRGALGTPVASRGTPVASRGRPVAAAGSSGAARAAGIELRELLLDPVLECLPAIEALRVVSDDVLHLLSLDALPLGDGHVGDRLALRCAANVQDLARPERGDEPEPVLVVLGDVDFGAEVASSGGTPLFAAAPPAEWSGGGGASGAKGGPFAELAGAAAEVELVGELFQARFGEEAVELSAAGATKSRLREEATRARYLHVATHGWFAPESVRSVEDGGEASGELRLALSRARGAILGFAPETLCGLALAGANRGRSTRGDVPGILTAEELAAFDLSRCELAVLSACETNVGIRRAGQGIQSLQAALHAAGARSAITSLWKVDDAATRRLMERFYTRLWKDGLGKADALWQAKSALRDEGHPLRDWAGWVLTGDPD